MNQASLLDPHLHENVRLKNVRHTHTLHVVAHTHQHEQRKAIENNFNRILKYCNPKVLHASLHMSPAVLEGVVRLCSLTALNLDGTCVSDFEVQIICSRLPLLELLSVRMTNISDGGFTELGALTRLKTLDVGHTLITHKTFQHVASLKQLERLTFDRCEKILNLSHLLPESSLKIINMSASGVSEASLSSLSRHENLTELDVGHFYGKITGRIFSSLDLKQLNKLRVCWCAVTDEHVASIAALTSLRHLDIRHNPITDVGLKELLNLSFLGVLDVSGCVGVTCVGVRFLFTMVQLRWLGVSGTGVTKMDVFMLRSECEYVQIMKSF